jgi:hypothetical protein
MGILNLKFFLAGKIQNDLVASQKATIVVIVVAAFTMMTLHHAHDEDR